MSNDGRRLALAGPAITAFSVAAATLLLQLVQTRIYSVVFWNHLVYFIISIALLGFGISGTWLSFGERSRISRFLTLRNSAALFLVTTLLASLYAPRLEISMSTMGTQWSDYFRLMLTYVTSVLPYFFAGWILGVVYRDYAESIHFLYFADLVGAAAGCLFFLAAIQPLGAPALVLIAAAFVFYPALLLAKKSFMTVVLIIAGTIALTYYGSDLDALNDQIQPEKTKALVALYEPEYIGKDNRREIEYSQWNTISRIDVATTFKNRKDKRIFIDGDAWTGMMVDRENPPPPWDPAANCLATWGTPYLIREAPDSVLVIGAGGGIDVYNALRASAGHIDAVEINPTTARIVADEYKELTKAVFDQDSVSLYCEEGRSFVRSSGKQYDVIIMNAIDTFAALNAGAYVLSESYLYTVDAIKDYISHLKPGGMLNISRWKTQGESIRLFTVMLEALHEMGYENPDRHLVVIFTPGNGFMGMMASSSPFSESDLAALREHTERHGAHFMFPIETTEYRYAAQRTFAQYAEARGNDDQQRIHEIFADARFDARPVWDDSPFFFNYLTFDQIGMALYEQTAAQILRGNWASLTLFSLLGFLILMVSVFMFAPLLKYGRGYIPHFKSWLVYFTCLGLAFIFVEIALMQRFALLLGHPARSLALVLATLLFFAGVGSNMQRKIRLPLTTLLIVLCGIILVAAFVYPRIILVVLGFPLWQRSAFTVLMVAPLGFFMGMPFPAGLRLVAGHGKDAVPWMWGINGGATVLGSVVAIILAMTMNFTTVFVAAAAGYFVAGVIFLRFSEAPAPIKTAPIESAPEPEPLADAVV